jgi:hypothetical protein
MPIKPYDPTTKAAFLAAATQARSAGKKWPEVHAAAKAAGYPGSVKGIIRMLEKSGAKMPSKPAKAAKKPVASPVKPTKPVAASAKKVPAPAAAKPVAKVSVPPKAKKSAIKKSTPKAKPTPGKRYSPAIKSKIMSAAIAARGAGKKWSEALQAAKAVGYRGSLQGIVKMIRAGNRKKIVRKPAAVKPAVTKRGPGRPKGIGKRLGRPPMKTVSVNGLGSIQAAVDRIVQERVNAALSRAIAVLETAR